MNQILPYVLAVILAITCLVLWWKVNRMKRQAKTLQKLGEKFIATIPHQIRTPLTAIKGYSSLILEGDYGPVSSELSEAHRMVFISAGNLSDIIDDYIDLARLSFGTIRYRREVVNVRHILEDLIRKFGKNLKNKTLELKEPIPGQYVVKGDIKKLTASFRRLLENAVKYTPQGSIVITLEKKKNSILVTIVDTGIGIPSNGIQNLFKEFERADNARAITAVGSGLGLYIAKQIIEAHHGKVWAESDGISKGARFFVQLPM